MAKTMRKKEFKNSNFGGKSSELLIQCWFPNKFDFSKNNTRLAWQSIPTKQGLVYVDILVINPMKTAVVGGDFS